MKEVKKFVCDICGKEYDKREECEECERLHPKMVKIKDYYQNENKHAMPDYVYIYGIIENGIIIQGLYEIKDEKELMPWSTHEIIKRKNIVEIQEV